MLSSSASTPTNGNRTTLLLAVLSIGLAFLCAALILSSDFHRTVRSLVGQTSVTPSTVLGDEARIRPEQLQIMGIATALGLAADTYDLSNAVKAIKNERNDLRNKFDTLDKQHRGLSQQHQLLADQHATLNHQHSALRKEHSALQSAKANYENRVKNSTRKLSGAVSTRVARNATRQIAAAPGKSIPFVGIGVVTALTAVDLYEGCEILKALNEMESEIGTVADTGTQTKVCGLKVPSQDEVASQLKTNWQGAYQTAATLANQSGKALPMTPPAIDTAQAIKQMCALSNGLWFCH